MKGIIRLLVFCTVASFQQNALAEQGLLSAKPNKCVALRKGQVCYQRIRLQFKSMAQGDYCLLADRELTPLRCWTRVSEGKYEYQLASDSEVKFHLLDSASNTVASTQVTVAWVYKKSRKRSTWRLF